MVVEVQFVVSEKSNVLELGTGVLDPDPVRQQVTAIAKVQKAFHLFLSFGHLLGIWDQPSPHGWNYGSHGSLPSLANQIE